jgi:hypothetical protein
MDSRGLMWRRGKWRGLSMKKQTCPVTALAAEYTKIFRGLAKIETHDDDRRATRTLQERQAFVERQTQSKEAIHPTGALFQLGLLKQCVESAPYEGRDDEIGRYLDMIARHLMSQGGKICPYSDPRDEEYWVKKALKAAA